MKNIFPIFALAIMFFCCGPIFIGLGNKFRTNENSTKSNAIFASAIQKKLVNKSEVEIFKAKNYIHWQNRSIKMKIERSTERIPFRLTIVKSAVFIDSYLGNKILPNNVVDLGNGYLRQPFALTKERLMNIDAFVQKIGHFKHILDSLNIPLVYVQYPNVICNEDNISKTGKDQNVYLKNELMKKLIGIDIPVIDLHKEFHQRANDSSKEFHHSLFYKTDHHWTAKTSISASQIISEKLNDFFDFGLETELLDTANFTEIFAKKWLGSIGERVIPLYPKEEFYIYSPKYATNISWLLHHSEYRLFENNGNFDSLYHFLSGAREDNGLYGTAYPRSFSKNNDLPNGKKILLIGDSFNNSLSKFFALVFKEVNFIYRSSSLLDDYLANKPDIVVIGFNNVAINEPTKYLLF